MDSHPVQKSKKRTELRADFRLAGRALVVLEVESDDPGAGQGGRTISADTRDLSAGGVRIETKVPVTVGALLAAKVQLNPSQPFHELAVDVMWCERVKSVQGCWQVGLKVVSSDTQAFLSWVDAVALALADA
ncbi:PilZ domain-containing protein [Marinobacter mobilis]|uniref:PilZ domain-containing protein n=1 Tax=Marinobacter mobilis TaxID=488533 RepID=A0A1H2V5V2_9GAMM|nr:PilZ domain-containing protein [Marinobacter mobilis]SDW63314.1 PilZ domain-containing protein [Marinobacter mobilis]